jgi:hypothetical protein
MNNNTTPQKPVKNDKKSKPPYKKTKHYHHVPEAVRATSGPANIEFL